MRRTTFYILTSFVFSIIFLAACSKQTLDQTPGTRVQPTHTARTPSFTQDGKPCQTSLECETGSTCTENICKEVVPEFGCQTDTDCILVNKDFEFDCCGKGACDPINYAQPSWMGVNKNWFETGKEKNCPPPSSCNPLPNCQKQLINENFEAKCVQGECQKAAKPGSVSCQDLCGDSTCQSVVCLGNRCPCIENSKTCPEDCD